MLRFRYLRIPKTRAAAPAGWLRRLFRWFLWRRVTPRTAPVVVSERPLIPVRVIGPGPRYLSHRQLALLDTGSVETVLPLEVAGVIGVQPGPEKGAIRWHGEKFKRHTATVEIELTRGGIAWRWQTTVVFSSAPIGYILLGDRGCLQFLDVEFLGEDRAVELKTNGSFDSVGTRTDR